MKTRKHDSISLVRRKSDTTPNIHNWTRDSVLQSRGHYFARKKWLERSFTANIWTDFYAVCGTRTRDPSNRAASHLHLLAYHTAIKEIILRIKGKAVSLQAWSGQEGSQDGGKVVSLTHRPPLPLENAPGTHFC
jgi:hypothetical protein